MLALLAANAYLGIADANLKHFSWFLASIGILAVVLLIFRLMGLVHASHRKNKSSWNTFRQLAKARGMSGAQIEVIALLARNARLKSPSKILGSILLFDRAVQQTQERVGFSEKQLILVESIRKKLVTTKVRWTAKQDERRQLERAKCSWNARMVHLSKDVVLKEMLRNPGDDDESLKGAIGDLIRDNNNEEEELVEHKVQIRDISAGGVSLLASTGFEGQEGDFGVLHGESQRIPFVMDSFCGEICSIEENEEKGYLILHYRFLTIDQELRMGIIQYVYQKMQQKNTKSKRREESAARVEEAS